jgi:hypothetical protein
VLLLVFNRPETTKAVMESLGRARPSRLYVAADGPRDAVHADLQRCEEARRLATAPSWECVLTTRLQVRNVGLNRHVSSALDWFFANEEQGIVLEDDCVPHMSFFRFCSELLEFHRDSTRVMHISGNNFQYGRHRGRASYYYSKYPFIWGWATWRRAWRKYDFRVIAPELAWSTWDGQWMTTLQRNEGLAVTPNANLVTNIGFGSGATHTKSIERYSALPALAMEFPITHPRELVADKDADTFVYYANFRNVRYLRLIWAYRAWDMIVRFLKRVKRGIRTL